jgi:hypothetical protein
MTPHLKRAITVAAVGAVAALAPAASAAAATPVTATTTPRPMLTFTPPSVGSLVVSIGPIIIDGHVISPGVYVVKPPVTLPPISFTPPSWTFH